MSVQEKLLSTDFDAWNDPRRATSVGGLFALIGATVGHFVVPHLVDIPVSAGFTGGFGTGAGFVVGLSLAALTD